MIQAPSNRKAVRPTQRVISRIQVQSAAKYQRRRAAIAVILITCMAGAFTALSSQGQAEASNQVSSAQFQYITVHGGDTLWSVAQKYAGDVDTRDWIAELVTLNALDQAALQPGQRIALPKR